uniref:Polybine-2 n=1 Tax=Polybia paulista TaxID=291283 RepID=PLYB2_POLPI|nr:RecName: Full=Polybine-2; AltName: Full=Polybine-II [Polybia paulista]
SVDMVMKGIKLWPL